MKKKEIVGIFALFLGWLMFLSVIVMVADRFLPYKPSFPYANEFFKYGLPETVTKLANFDGVHYLTIAAKGYLETELIQAFFPLYPMLMSAINYLLANQVVSGLVISHLFALLSFYALYYLVKMDYGEKTAWVTVVIFACFACSFYLRSLYNESLFMTLLLSSFIAVRKKHYCLAGLLGGLASATRVVGIFIFPSLLLFVFLEDKKNFSAYLKVSLSVLGLLAYMIYLKWHFDDYFFFFHVQEKFEANRQSQLILFPQVIYRYLKIFTTLKVFDLKFYAYLQEFVIAILTFVGLGEMTWQKLKHKWQMPWPYLLFASGAFFTPTMTGNFSSMPRYVLVCFPIFIYLAHFFTAKQPLYLFLYLTTSLIFLIINLVLFSQGYWVA